MGEVVDESVTIVTGKDMADLVLLFLICTRASSSTVVLNFGRRLSSWRRTVAKKRAASLKPKVQDLFTPRFGLASVYLH